MECDIKSLLNIDSTEQAFEVLNDKIKGVNLYNDLGVYLSLYSILEEEQNYILNERAHSALIYCDRVSPNDLFAFAIDTLYSDIEYDKAISKILTTKAGIIDDSSCKLPFEVFASSIIATTRIRLCHHFKPDRPVYGLEWRFLGHFLFSPGSNSRMAYLSDEPFKEYLQQFKDEYERSQNVMSLRNNLLSQSWELIKQHGSRVSWHLDD